MQPLCKSCPLTSLYQYKVKTLRIKTHGNTGNQFLAQHWSNRFSLSEKLRIVTLSVSAGKIKPTDSPAGTLAAICACCCFCRTTSAPSPDPQTLERARLYLTSAGKHRLCLTQVRNALPETQFAVPATPAASLSNHSEISEWRICAVINRSA